jgi:kynurenine formamidase
LIDLSHRIDAGMPMYPGVPAPEYGAVVTHASSAARGTYAPGVSFEMTTYTIGGNTGTYLDSPFHRDPEAADLAAVPLDRLANLSGLVITAPSDGPIGPNVLEGTDLTGKAVLFHTGWARRWGTDGYFRSGPYLTAETCGVLVAAGAALAGIDCANIDSMADPQRPAHTLLLRAGILIVEHLRGVEALPPAGFQFFAVPPAIAGGASFPVRAFAIV